VSDQLAYDEFDAIRKAREWMHALQWRKPETVPRNLNQKIEEPIYDRGDINSFII